MALHPHFPKDPNAILDPAIRWFPADEALREKSANQLIPPLVAKLRKVDLGMIVQDIDDRQHHSHHNSGYFRYRGFS